MGFLGLYLQFDTKFSLRTSFFPQSFEASNLDKVSTNPVWGHCSLNQSVPSYMNVGHHSTIDSWSFPCFCNLDQIKMKLMSFKMNYNTLFCHFFCDQNNGVRVFPSVAWRKREIQQESDLLISSCRGLPAFVKCNVLGTHLDSAV